MRKPCDKPKPPGGPKTKLPGGHAARRLEEFLEGRFPNGVPAPEDTSEEKPEPDQDATEQKKKDASKLKRKSQ